MRTFSWRAAVAALAIFGLGVVAEACNVPVFRFALERWRPDPYRVVLFHRGELTAEQQELLRPLTERQVERTANLALRTVDLGKTEGEADSAERALYAALGEPALPWLVVEYPAHLKIPKPAWAGALSAEAVAAAIDSPLRRELGRRLLAGQTAVWLILEGSSAAENDSAAALVQEQLTKLEQQLELPELTSSPDDALATSLPLELKFSVLRVPREAAEQGLNAMLIGAEPDLAERSDPMVFPVFGRGRALLPLIGAGINAKNIHDAAAFLAGPCSCEVKEQNPGFDLLLATDWDGELAEKGIALTALETRTPTDPEHVELVPIPAGSTETAAAPAPTEVKNAAASQPASQPQLPAAQPAFVLYLLGAVVVVGSVLVMVATRVGG